MIKYITFLKVNLFIILFTQNLLAQQGINYKEANSFDVAITTGYFLPYRINGVTDTYPFWGLSFGFPTLLSQVELMALHGRSKQVIFYKYSLGYRIDFSLYDAIQGFISIGYEASTYKRAPRVNRTYDFVTESGLYSGFGALIPIKGDLCFRSDFKFSFNPGKSLYVGLGFHYIF